MSENVLIKEGNCYGYLIELYHQKKLTYRMDNSKLNYLLVIFAMCYMKNGIEPFTLIKKYNKLKPEYSFPFEFDTKWIAPFKQEDGSIDRDVVYSNYKSLPSYNAPIFSTYKYATLLEQEKNVLKEIFYSFGNFSKEDLSEMIAEISNNFSYLNKQNCSYLQCDSVFSYFDNDCHTENKISEFVNKCNIDKTFYMKDFDVEKIKDFLYFYLITENNAEVVFKRLQNNRITETNILTMTLSHIKNSPEDRKASINEMLNRWGPVRVLALIGMSDNEIIKFKKQFVDSDKKVKNTSFRKFKRR